MYYYSILHTRNAPTWASYSALYPNTVFLWMKKRRRGSAQRPPAAAVPVAAMVRPLLALCIALCLATAHGSRPLGPATKSAHPLTPAVPKRLADHATHTAHTSVAASRQESLSDPRVDAAVAAHFALIGLIEIKQAGMANPSDDAFLDLCVSRANALAEVVDVGTSRHIEAAVDVAFALTTGARAELPETCAPHLEWRYDGLADIVTVVTNWAPAERERRRLTDNAKAMTTHRHRLTPLNASLDYSDFVALGTMSHVVTYGARRTQRTGNRLPVHGFAINASTFVLAESPVRCLAATEAAEQGLGATAAGHLWCSDGVALTEFADAQAADTRALEVFVASQQSHASATQQSRRAQEETDTYSEFVRGPKTALFLVSCMTDHDCSSAGTAYDYVSSDIYDYLTDQAQIVGDYFREASWGVLDLTIVVMESVDMLTSSYSCADMEDLFDDAMAEAKTQASAAGYDTNIDSAVMFFPTCSLSWAGLGYVGIDGSWINTNGVSDAATIAHEVAHNYGANHASDRMIEYGNIYSVMGQADLPAGHFLSVGKEVFDWMSDVRRSSCQLTTLARCFDVLC